jgi:hypothetical protein
MALMSAQRPTRETPAVRSTLSKPLALLPFLNVYSKLSAARADAAHTSMGCVIAAGDAGCHFIWHLARLRTDSAGVSRAPYGGPTVNQSSWW